VANAETTPPAAEGFDDGLGAGVRLLGPKRWLAVGAALGLAGVGALWIVFGQVALAQTGSCVLQREQEIVRSPVAGVLTSWLKEAGEVVERGDTVVTVAATRPDGDPRLIGDWRRTLDGVYELVSADRAVVREALAVRGAALDAGAPVASIDPLTSRVEAVVRLTCKARAQVVMGADATIVLAGGAAQRPLAGRVIGVGPCLTGARASGDADTRPAAANAGEEDGTPQASTSAVVRMAVQTDGIASGEDASSILASGTPCTARIASGSATPLDLLRERFRALTGWRP